MVGLDYLPLDLILIILSHLPLSHYFKLQQLSTHWRDVLTGKGVQAALRRWTMYDSTENSKQEADAIALMLQHLKGHPARTLRIHDRRVVKRNRLRSLLAGHHAVTRHQDEKNFICNLRTCEWTELESTSKSVALGSRLVALIISATSILLYAVPSLERQCFEVPGPKVLDMIAVHDTLVMGVLENQQYRMWTYDATTMVMTDISLPEECGRPDAVAIDADYCYITSYQQKDLRGYYQDLSLDTLFVFLYRFKRGSWSQRRLGSQRKSKRDAAMSDIQSIVCDHRVLIAGWYAEKWWSMLIGPYGNEDIALGDGGIVWKATMLRPKKQTSSDSRLQLSNNEEYLVVDEFRPSSKGFLEVNTSFHTYRDEHECSYKWLENGPDIKMLEQ